MEDNTIPVVTRTQVYLTDPEFFCNKSWTISYNMNTNSWVSFHSYIPNWYMGENNFFYSGINGCCDDFDSNFIAFVGDTNKPTTSTTTTIPTRPNYTTTIRYVPSCDLVGEATELFCELAGEVVITVSTTTTTTTCIPPDNLFTYTLYSGYQYGSGMPIDSTSSLNDMCNAMAIIRLGNPSISAVTINGYAFSLDILQLVYDNEFSSCTFIPDGYYYTLESLSDGYGYYVTSGYIARLVDCNCGTTTTTTTIAPTVGECCGLLFSAADKIYLLNDDDNPITEIIVPGYVSGYGIAMTANKFWSVDTQFIEWDIALSPFSAIFNRNITFPVGFTTSSGIVAIDDVTLITIDDSTSPQDVIEMDVTGLAGVATIMFSLQTDRVAIGNMLYTTEAKLIIINQDTISSDYYITQYDYATSVIEIDLNVGTSYDLVTLSECNCIIFAGDTSGNLYAVDELLSGVLIPIFGTGLILESATQVASCVPQSLNSNGNILPTTTTTTTVFVPNPFCYTITVSGNGTATFTWIDYLGVPQVQTLANETIYICAQLNTIDGETTGEAIVTLTGGITSCTSDGDCTPTTTTTTTIP